MKTFINFLPAYNGYFPCDAVVSPLSGHWTDFNGINAYKQFALTNSSQSPEYGSSSSGNVSTYEPLAIRLQAQNETVFGMCQTKLDDNFVISLTEYANFSSFRLMTSTNFDPWDIPVRLVLFGYPNRFFRNVADLIQLHDVHGLELLTHGQPLDGPESSVTLWRIFGQFLDWKSVVASNLLTIVSTTFCLSLLNLLPTRWKRNFTANVRHVISRYLLVWLSLFCSHGGEFQHKLTKTPFSRLKLSPLKLITVLILLTSSLFWGFLYTQLFNDQLLNQLIKQDHFWFESIAQFLDTRDKYNIKFVSYQSSLFRFFDEIPGIESIRDELTRLVEKHHTLVDDKEQLLDYSTQRNYIINTETLGCEDVMLSDPYWESKYYRCMTQKSLARRMAIVINRAFVSHPEYRRVRGLTRAIQETGLMRRPHWTYQELFHLSLMKGSLFESHTDDIPSLSFGGFSTIFNNVGYMYVAIVIILVHFYSASALCVFH